MTDESASQRTEDSQPTQEFLRLYLGAERRLYGYIVSSLPNLTDADDVMQETVLFLWERFDDFAHGSDFLAWACTIARFRVLKYYKSQKRVRLLGDEALEAVLDEMSEMRPELDDSSEALDFCVEKLSEADRDLIRSRYCEGASTKTVAEQSGKSVASVYKAVSRIQQWLQKCVRRRLRQEDKS